MNARTPVCTSEESAKKRRNMQMEVCERVRLMVRGGCLPLEVLKEWNGNTMMISVCVG